MQNNFLGQPWYWASPLIWHLIQNPAKGKHIIQGIWCFKGCWLFWWTPTYVNQGTFGSSCCSTKRRHKTSQEQHGEAHWLPSWRIAGRVAYMGQDQECSFTKLYILQTPLQTLLFDEMPNIWNPNIYEHIIGLQNPLAQKQFLLKPWYKNPVRPHKS